MTRGLHVWAGVLLGSAVVGAATQTLQAPDLDSVLQRAGVYVAQYQKEFSLLIADEHYVQEVLSDSAVKDRRTLVSEFALVRVQDADRTLWLAFRDVLQVDGRPVHDRAERLQRLFVTRPADALPRARAIALESARYNIGPLVRTVNVPTIALEFLATAARSRSRFGRRGEETLQGVRAWSVTFEERARPSLIRTPEGKDVAASGVAWIDPSNGRVLRTQIGLTRPKGLTTRVTVTYASDDRLGSWVPVGMEERYETESWRLTGKAVYTNYRRFETEVRLKSPQGAVR